MKSALLAITVLGSLSLQAQSYFYYNDIIGPQEMSQELKTYVQQNVKSISAVGYTPAGARASDFSETIQLLDNGKTLKISKIVSLNGTTIIRSFDETSRLIQISDSTAGVKDITRFEYDGNNRLTKVQNITYDDSKEFTDTEVHQWFYTPDGKLDKMYKTINGSDSTVVKFVLEEHGLPGEEICYKNGRETDHIYYYYNDEKNRLTDIVRYNNKIKKLVPEVIFTYDDNDRVIQKVVSSSGDSYGIKSMGSIYFVRYIIWRFIFNQQGLKTKEALFDKNQELTGKIEYTYSLK